MTTLSLDQMTLITKWSEDGKHQYPLYNSAFFSFKKIKKKLKNKKGTLFSVRVGFRVKILECIEDNTPTAHLHNCILTF